MSYNTCFLEKPHQGPITAGRGNRHTIFGPGLWTTRAWLKASEATIGNSRNDWTITQVGGIIAHEYYAPSRLGKWPR